MEIPKIDPFWDDQLVSQAHGGHRHSAPTVQQPIGLGSGGVPGGAHSPYERNLNFATVAVEDGEYGFPKKKTVRDPLSHRIIEKRRRDRMNNCLADLARLLPPSSLRKGRGRIEKTEIVELAIKHLRHLQCHPCPMGDKCEFGVVTDNGSSSLHNNSSAASCSSISTSSGYHSKPEEQFRLGFQECLSEAMHFLVEQEGLYAGDAMCVRLVKHLNGHCETVLRDHWGNQGKVVPGFRRANESNPDFKKTGCSGGSISSGYHPNGSSSGSDGNGGNDGEMTEPFALPVQSQNISQYNNVERQSSSILDYEAENSCSSTPLSIETSDVLSLDGKNNNNRLLTKPPIPSIICSHSSNNSRVPVNSGSPVTGSTNGRSSDDGSANSSTSSAHRYKYKSNITGRFTADCQVKLDDGPSHSGADCDRDVDLASDTEEIREERISVLEEGLSCRQSGEDEEEGKSIKESASSIGADASGKTTESISAADTSSPSSTPSSLTDKTVPLSSPTSNIFAIGAKSSTSSSSTATPTPLANNLEGRDVEVKPSPEELLTAIQKLNACGGIKNALPLIIGGELPLIEEGKGIPAFALHEKGLFYIPMTIDKSVVSLYMNKLDSTEAPPLYPVTISVCFLPKLDKKGKLGSLHGIHETEIVAPHQAKATDFIRSAVSPIPLPLITAVAAVAAPPTKPSRKGYREGNPFLTNRHSHHQSHRPALKDPNSLARLSGTGNTSYGSNYKILPLHSSYLTSAYDFYRGSSASSNSSMLTIPATGGTIYNGNYPHGSSPSSSVTRGVGENNQGGESEGHSSSGCGRSSNAGAGDGSNSGSSGTSGNGNVSRSRKRSFSSSPSISGGSVGYHSWHDKASPNSPDFFNYHLNTHNLQAMAVHGHGLAPGATPTNGGVSPAMEQRHGGQVLNTFHGDNNGLGEKQAMCYSHDKRAKKTRSFEQKLDYTK